jgi:hypothetical protein
MAFIILLLFLSIYGAFIGAERAKAFFNSVPLAVYWIVLILLLEIGIALFPRLVRKPALPLHVREKICQNQQPLGNFGNSRHYHNSALGESFKTIFRNALLRNELANTIV